MKPFTESCKYDYNLTRSSVVIDCGAHEGNWSSEIWKRYGCKIYAFEPVKEFYWKCQKKLASTTVSLLPFGLGDHSRFTEFGIHGDMSGQFSDGPKEDVEIESLADFLDLAGLGEVDLFKLNCEGMEMELLEGMLDRGQIRRFKNILVQPHTVADDSQNRWTEIKRRMAETHELEFDEPWIWTGWRLK